MTPEHLPTEQYDAQLAEKVVRLQSLMTPFYAQAPEVFRSPVSHYRMRAEFRLWHDGDDLYHIMFDSPSKDIKAPRREMRTKRSPPVSKSDN